MYTSRNHVVQDRFKFSCVKSYVLILFRIMVEIYISFKCERRLLSRQLLAHLLVDVASNVDEHANRIFEHIATVQTRPGLLVPTQVSRISRIKLV